MSSDRRSLTHCPSCGREVDRLRAGAVGIFSGKMSYFCSRECRDRFAASGKGSHGEDRTASEPKPTTRATGPRPGEIPRKKTSPPKDPVTPGGGSTEPMLPLLMPDAAERPPAAGSPREERGGEDEAARMAPPSAADGGYVPVVAREAESRSGMGRWLLSSAAGGIAILVVHLLVTWAHLQPTKILALSLLVPAVLVGLVNAMLEWKSSTLHRALDEIIVLGAVVLTSLPAMVSMARGADFSLSDAALAPVGVLVVVWLSRALESLLGRPLHRQALSSSVHARGALESLFLVPGRFGRSRSMKASRALCLAFTVCALPAGLMVAALAWILTGSPGEASHWSMASAVTLSLAPRLVRNVLPPVLAAGLLRAREMGIVFRDDLELEKAGEADAVVLRKRGVLVEPGSDVVEFHHLGELPRETILALVASCEEIASRSVPAEALMRYARSEGVRPGDTRLTRWFASKGVQSTSPFGEVFVGNRLFLIENGISVGRGEEVAQEAEKRGHTAIFISINRQIEAVAVLVNRLHPSGRPAMDRARKLGIASILVTGDSARTAESIGQAVGVDQIRPEVAVGGREKEIARLRDSGYRLAVLGNVSMGPEEASDDRDVNLALGWDGDAPVDARWSITVRGDDLQDGVNVLELARRCRTFVRANWTISMVMGGLTLGLAASGLAGPVVAALAVNAACAAMMAVRPKLAQDP